MSVNIEQLREQFALADPRYGPVAWWWWSAEEVTAERIRWQLKKFRDAGLRNIGLIQLAPRGPMFGSPSDQPVYMTEEWWRLVAVTLREAERLGMYLWFYDQIGFSGANLTAHIVADFPEYAGYQLYRFAPDEALPASAEILLESEHYRYVAVRQGFNWLDRAATETLIDRVYGEIERRFPHDLGRTIAGSFQDELPPLSLWSPELSTLYVQRYGEDLHQQLAALFEDAPGAEAIRRRVYGLAAELVEQAFFKPLGDWHSRHGMLLACDQAGPARRADPHGAQRLYHDYFRTQRWFNAPGSDMDGEIKPHASMAHLHGGKRVMLEAFHSSGWGGSLEETMHWILPWLVDGATLYFAHAVYYSTRGGWWEWAPPDTGWRQPYFEHYAHFADSISRICYLLSQGEHVCDIAVHYPAHAIQGHMSLSDIKRGAHPMGAANRVPNERVGHIRDIYWGLTGFRNRRDQRRRGALREHGRDFDIVDDLALAGATPQGDRLQIANESFAVLLLCGTAAMSDEARRQLERWIAQGGRVIAVDVPEDEALPGVIAVATPQEAAQLIAQTLPRRVDGPGEALQRRVNNADVFLLLPPPSALLAMHEAADDAIRTPEPARYRLRTNGRPQLWSPVDGSVQALPYQREGNVITVEVPFSDWPAALLVCVEEQASTAGAQPPAGALARGGVGRRGSRDLSARPWQVRVESTLDNRYGDFDLHGDERGLLPLDRRHMRVGRETVDATGLDLGWHTPAYDDAAWPSFVWSEAVYWLTSRGETFDEATARPVVYSNIFGNLAERTWMGRMGAVPRRFLDLGRVGPEETAWARSYVLAPADGDYFLSLEGDYRLGARINGREVAWDPAPDRQVGRVSLRAGLNQLLLYLQPPQACDGRVAVEVSPVERPPLPAWSFAKNPGPRSALSTCVECDPHDPIRSARVIFAAKGRAILYVNGTRVTEHGDFHPISRYGQEELDVTELWRPGANEVRVVLPEGSGEVLIDGFAESRGGAISTFSSGPQWHDEAGEPAGVVFGAEGMYMFGSDKEAMCIRPRPHPLPGVGWLMPDSAPTPPPLPFVAEPSSIGRPVWLRFPLPVGAVAMQIETAGQARVWIGGAEVEVRAGRAVFPPQSAGTLAAVRVEPEGPVTDAAVLRQPIRFETAPLPGRLGDWRSALALPHFSGAVEYETLFESDDWQSVVLDLGHVRGTAEVWLDGAPIGVRIWRPYRFKLGSLPRGAHRLRIRVTNTLGAHYQIGRPTSMVAAHPGFFPEAAASPRAQPDRFAAGGLFGPVTIQHERCKFAGDN